MPEPRELIAKYWPDHLAHLAPEGSKMGQATVHDPDGVVCNCGMLLGHPDQVAESPSSSDGPDTPREAADVLDGMYGEPPDSVTAVAVQVNAWDAWADDPGGIHLLEAWGDEDPQPTEPADEAQATVAPLPARPSTSVPAEDPLSGEVIIIDPSLPYGPAEVEQQLLYVEQRLERGIHFQRWWEDERHYAAVAFELASARAMVRVDAEGRSAADVRKAKVLLACEEEWVRLQVADTMVRSVRECMHNLRSLQTGYQTVARSVAESMRSHRPGA